MKPTLKTFAVVVALASLPMAANADTTTPDKVAPMVGPSDMTGMMGGGAMKMDGMQMDGMTGQMMQMMQMMQMIQMMQKMQMMQKIQKIQKI